MADHEDVLGRDPFDSDDLERLVSLAYDGSLADAHVLDRGRDIIYRVDIDGRDGSVQAILKAAGHSDAEQLRREAEVLEHVSRTTAVPVPGVIGAVPAPSEEYPPYFLMEFVDGCCLNSLGNPYAGNDAFGSDELATLSASAGRHLARIHELGPLDGAGPISVVNDHLESVDSVTAWHERVRRSLRAPHVDQLGAVEVDVRTFVENGIDLITDVDLVPIHGDYRPGNLVLDPEHFDVRAVLDWGDARSAHHEYDLVLTEQYLSVWSPVDSELRQTVRENLYSGYRHRRELHRGERFERRRRLYRVLTRIDVLRRIPYFPDDVGERRLEHHRQCLNQLLETASDGA